MLWKFTKVFTKQNKMMVWTGAKWLKGGCRFMHGLNLVSGLRPRVCYGSRPSQLRTGLGAFLCYAYNGLCHIVLPHALVGRIWLNNLWCLSILMPLWCVGGWLGPRVFNNPYSHWRKRGLPEVLRAKGGETLAGISTLRQSIVKALARALDCSPKVVSGGIDGCRTN